MKTVPAGMNDVHGMDGQHDHRLLSCDFFGKSHMQLELPGTIDDISQHMIDSIRINTCAFRNDLSEVSAITAQKFYG